MSFILEHRLFTIIKKCYQAKFWQDYDDTQLVAIQLPKEKEPIFISIIGKDDEAYGFLIYRGYQEMAGLYHALQEMDDEAKHINQQSCIAIYFEDRENLTRENYNRIKQAKVSFRGRKAWPIVVDFEPGFVPIPLMGDHVLWFIHALEKFYETAQSLRKEMSIYDLEEVKNFTAFPGRSYNIDQQYEPKIFSIPKKYRQGINLNSITEYPNFLSRFENLRAKQLPIKSTIWELDLQQIATPAEQNGLDQEAERPFYPLLLMIADKASQELLMLDLMRTNDVEAFQRSLIRFFFKKKTRPTAICVNHTPDSLYAYSYFKQLLKDLDISIHLSDSLPTIDLMKEDLIPFTQIEK